MNPFIKYVFSVAKIDNRKNADDLRKISFSFWGACLFFGVLLACFEVQAGWVWSENGSGAYSGTAAPWTVDDSVTGKLVRSGTTNTFTGDVNVTGTGADQYLTIDNATVSTTMVTRVSQDVNPAYFTIQNGGTFSTTNTFSISDSKKVSMGYVTVDGGTLTSTSEIRLGYHWKGYLDVKNGGTVKANTLSLGGGMVDDTAGRFGQGYLTVGGMDSESDTGMIEAQTFTMGASGDSKADLNRGTMTIGGSATIGTTFVDPTIESADVTFNVNQYGTLNVVNGTISVGNHAVKDSRLNVVGGTVDALRIVLGDAAGKGTLNIENGTVNEASVTSREKLVVGNKGTGELNLKSGTLLIGSESAPKSLYLGGFDSGTSGTGTVNLSGGDLNVNELNVGYRGTGTLNVTGGTVTATNGLFVGRNVGSSGTVNIGSADGQNTPTLTFAAAVSLAIENDATGTLEMKNGSLSAKSVDVGLKNNATMTVSGGTVTTTGNFNVGANANVKGTVNIGSADGQNTPTIKVGGAVNLNVGSTLSMTNGSLSATTTNVDAATLNVTAGTYTSTASTGLVIKNGGTVNFGSADSPTISNITLAGSVNIGNESGGTVTIRNATVTSGVEKQADWNIGGSGTSTENLLDIGAGGKLISDGIVRITRAATSPGTAYLHDGGVWEHTGTFNMGDVRESAVAYLIVDGAGSTLKLPNYASMGYHNTAMVTVSNGGTIDAVSISLGVNKQVSTILPSQILLAGEGSLLKVSTLNLGNVGSGQGGILNLMVSETGLGKVEATSINRTAASEINLGVDHSISMIRNYDEDGYTIATVNSGWNVTHNDLWKMTQNGTTYTATLDTAKQQAGTLEITQGPIEITAGLETAGWIPANFGLDTLVELELTGLDTMENTQLLADWLSEGTDDAYRAMVSGLGDLTLSGLLPGTGVFAWDFSDFNTATGLTVGLSEMKAYVPEPTAWMMLLLGSVLIFRRKKAAAKVLCLLMLWGTGTLFAANTAMQVTTSDWATATDWTNGVPQVGDDAYLGMDCTVTATDQTINLNKLTIGYASGNYATNPGVGRLTTNNGLTVGTLNIGLNNNYGGLTVQGGVLNVGTGTSHSLTVYRGDMDLASADEVNINVGNFHVVTDPASNPSRTCEIKFGKVTTITANVFSVLDSTVAGLPTMFGNITFGSESNTLNVDTVTLGGGKAEGSGNKSVAVTVDGGSFSLGGKTSGTKATLQIAYNDTSTANPSYANVDLSGASSVNLTLSNVGIGYNAELKTASKTTIGSLNLGDKATVTADNFYIARYVTTSTANTGSVSGTLSFGGTSDVTVGTVAMGSGDLSTSAWNMTGGTLSVTGSFTSLGSSTYTQTAGNATIAGSFSVGAMTSFGTETSAPTLTVGTQEGTSDTVTIGTGAETLAFDNGTMDFSKVETTTLNFAAIHMMTSPSAEGINVSPTLKLGKNNVITATSLSMLDTEGVNLNGSTATITLGSGVNQLNMDTLTVGGAKVMGVKDTITTGATVTLPANGSLVLKGKADGAKASLRIADDTAASTGGPSNGTMDLSAGASVSMTLSDLSIGYNKQLYTSTNGETTGVLNLGNHATVTADSISMGTYNTTKTQGGYSKGTLTGSGTITVGTVETPGFLRFGNGAWSKSTLTLSGGTLAVHGDVSGAGAINMTLGTVSATQKFKVDSGDVNLGSGSGTLTVVYGDIDFSAVENTNVHLGTITMLNAVSGKNTSAASSSWTLGTNSTITANSFVMAESGEGNLLRKQVTVTLGSGTNDLNIADFIVGGNKSDGTDTSKTGVAAKVLVADGGKVLLDGKAEGELANLRIGYNSFDSTSDVAHGLVDFSNASEVTMNLDDLAIGYNKRTDGTSAASTRYTTGELNLGDHAMVTANALTLGTFSDSTNKNSVQGTLTFSGDTQIAVNGTVTLGKNSTLSNSALNMAGGELTAQRMTMAGNADFNWTGGTLGVGNIDFALTQNALGTSLNPGGSNAIGETTVAGDYTLSDGELRLEADVDGIDTLHVMGDTTFGENALFVVDVLSLDVPVNTWSLITSESAVMPTLMPIFEGFTQAVPFWSYGWTGEAGNWTFGLTTSPVPEPASWLLLVLGACFLKRRNRF